ncbi:MAG: CehA/McbA family metallohydrolase [Haloferacaceae archaeon]
MLSVELHAHSALSHDGRDPVEALLERAEVVGLDGLAVTDHDAIEASLEAERLAPDYGLVGIPGMEVSSAAGHVLALGVRDLVPAGLPFEETVERIRDQGGVAVVPHPFQRSRHGVARRVDRDTLATADAIEVFNSRLLTGIANRRARNFAAARGLPMTAGSDAHIKEMVGRAATDLATDERSVGAVLDAIRDGRTSVTGRRTPWHVSVRQAAGGAKRRVLRRVADLW